MEQGAGFGILSWTDNGTPAPVTLPGGAQPIQVSANYGLAGALSSAGDAYCWDAGGNHSLGLTSTPTLQPIEPALQMISVGQNNVCGVSFDGTLECHAAWYDTPFLPTAGSAPNFQVRQSTFPAVREVQVGFGQGIIVRTDGTAAYLGGGVAPPGDNPGEPFTGVTNIVAAGGDRGSAMRPERRGRRVLPSRHKQHRPGDARRRAPHGAGRHLPAVTRGHPAPRAPFRVFAPRRTWAAYATAPPTVMG